MDLLQKLRPALLMHKTRDEAEASECTHPLVLPAPEEVGFNQGVYTLMHLMHLNTETLEMTNLSGAYWPSRDYFGDDEEQLRWCSAARQEERAH